MSDPFDVFNTLGSEKPRGAPTEPFVGLGCYDAEVVAVTLKPSTHEKKKGHLIFRAEFINRKTLAAISGPALAALNARVEELAPGRGKPYSGTISEGQHMVEVYNLTKHGEYAMADVRALMGALIAHAKTVLDKDQKAALAAAAKDPNVDEWNVFARMVCAGDGQLFAGVRIRITKRPHPQVVSKTGLAMPRIFFDNEMDGPHSIGIEAAQDEAEDAEDAA